MHKSTTSLGKAFWFEQIEFWRKSSLSQKEYCRRANLKLSTFSKFKIMKIGRDKIKLPTDKSSLELVAIPVSTFSVRADDFTSSGLSIKLGTSSQIEIAKNCDRNCLEEILRVLSGL